MAAGNADARVSPNEQFRRFRSIAMGLLQCDGLTEAGEQKVLADFRYLMHQYHTLPEEKRQRLITTNEENHGD